MPSSKAIPLPETGSNKPPPGQDRRPLARAAPGAGQGIRAIEADFPFLEVSRLAQLESYRKNVYRPAYYIHKWWARRTGTTFRAILLGTLLR
jgi:hypothetical protein